MVILVSFLFTTGFSQQEPRQKSPDDEFRKETVRIPPRTRTHLIPGNTPVVWQSTEVTDVVELCEGVYPGLTTENCVRILSGTRLFCNTSDKPVYRLDVWGTGESLVSDQACIYDCTDASCRTNENRVQPMPPELHPYRIDAHEMRQNPKFPKTVQDQEGVISILLSMLGRNWERDSTDDQEWGDGEFDTLRIRVLPQSVLAGLLPQDFDLASRLTTKNAAFLYSEDEAIDDARKQIIAAVRPQNDTYPNVNLLGSYLNRKPWYHAWPEKIRGETGVECEHAACDEFGPQVLAFDEKTYGIASWNRFKSLADTENLVFIVTTGDGGPKRDDLIALFPVSMRILRSEKRILHTQKNTKGGTDLLLMFELDLHPKFE